MRKVITVCDLHDEACGTDATRTITLGWQGKNYSLDLCPDGLTEVSDFMKRVTAHAQETGRQEAAPRTRRSSTMGISTEEAREVRAWAEKEGIKAPSRGRLAQSLIDQFHAAQAGKTPEKLPEVAVKLEKGEKEDAIPAKSAEGEKAAPAKKVAAAK